MGGPGSGRRKGSMGSKTKNYGTMKSTSVRGSMFMSKKPTIAERKGVLAGRKASALGNSKNALAGGSKAKAYSNLVKKNRNAIAQSYSVKSKKK
jgi:hypothetical protein